MEETKTMGNKQRDFANQDETICKIIGALKQQAEEMSRWHERYAEQRKGVLTAIRIVEDVTSMQKDMGTQISLPSAQPSDEYERGWKEGREALREETWEYVRDRFD